MTETDVKINTMKTLRPTLRISLLVLQVLLPLAAYYALQNDRMGLTWGLAAAFALSMAGLIWLG